MMDNISITALANGVRVVTSAANDVQSAAIGIWTGAGGRYEPKRLAGVSHFLEHLLFKGTKKRSSKRISQSIEGCGGYLNAFTQEESTCYYARVSYDRVWKALDVLADMYLNSRFDPVEIEKERGVIIEEMMMYRDQPHHLVLEMLGGALWRNHPLGIPIIGLTESLKSMKRGDILDYRRSKYVPGNTLFVFTGNVDQEQCVDRVGKHVGMLRAGRLPVCRPVTARTGQEHTILLEKEVEQAHLALGVRIFGRHDRRRYAMKLLSVILGENMSSRLFQTVREKHGLAYSVHSSSDLYKDTGTLTITAGLDHKRHVRGIELIIRELAALKNKPVAKSELKRAKEYVIGQMRLALESTSSQMMSLGDTVLAYDKFVPPDEIIRRIEAVTVEDIQRLARSAIRRKRVSLALVAPSVAGSEESCYRGYLGML